MTEFEHPPGPALIWTRPDYTPRRSRRQIATEVAAYHGLTLDQLIHGGRTRLVVWPRQDAMLAMLETGYISYPKMGAFFGLDHTTCMHGAKAALIRRERAEARAA